MRSELEEIRFRQWSRIRKQARLVFLRPVSQNTLPSARTQIPQVASHPIYAPQVQLFRRLRSSHTRTPVAAPQASTTTGTMMMSPSASVQHLPVERIGASGHAPQVPGPPSSLARRAFLLSPCVSEPQWLHSLSINSQEVTLQASMHWGPTAPPTQYCQYG